MAEQKNYEGVANTSQPYIGHGIIKIADVYFNMETMYEVKDQIVIGGFSFEMGDLETTCFYNGVSITTKEVVSGAITIPSHGVRAESKDDPTDLHHYWYDLGTGKFYTNERPIYWFDPEGDSVLVQRVNDSQVSINGHVRDYTHLAGVSGGGIYISDGGNYTCVYPVLEEKDGSFEFEAFEGFVRCSSDEPHASGDFFLHPGALDGECGYFDQVRSYYMKGDFKDCKIVDGCHYVTTPTGIRIYHYKTFNIIDIPDVPEGTPYIYKNNLFLCTEEGVIKYTWKVGPELDMWGEESRWEN